MKTFFVIAAAITVMGCGIDSGRSDLSVVNWNLQTFFDALTVGNEYDEFRGAKTTWTAEKYKERVTRVSQVIAALDKNAPADVITFEEIENAEVIADIANELAGHLARDKQYPYAAFAAAPGSSIGCGVISRLPLNAMTVHAVDVRKGAVAPPSMRPLLEVTVSTGAKKAGVTIYVAHWKSKVGGEDAASSWQNYQAAVLGKRAALKEAEPNRGIIAIGDFNRDIGDFSTADDGTVLIGGHRFTAGWNAFSAAATGQGSYYFRGQWERIDNAFTAGNCTLLSFAAETQGPWVTEKDGEKIPYRYMINSGKGYSDHLPVRCTVHLGG